MSNANLQKRSLIERSWSAIKALSGKGLVVALNNPRTRACKVSRPGLECIVQQNLLGFKRQKIYINKNFLNDPEKCQV